MLADAAYEAGVTVGTLLLPLVILSIALEFIGLSLIAARAGVARPDLDVLFVIIRRPGRDAHELPGTSIGGAMVQILSNFGVYPIVAWASPAILYRPELGPSVGLLSAAVGSGLGAFAIAWLVWGKRVTKEPPVEQEREAGSSLRRRCKPSN